MVISGAMLVPELSFGTRQGSFASSSCASRRVSHGGDGHGQGDGQEQRAGKGEEIVKEKRKERPELKVVICKDGRSSARVSLKSSSMPT